MRTPRVVVGYVNHQSYADLESSLESVRTQSLRPVSILVVDVDSNAQCLETLQQRFPEVEWRIRPNRGYGAGGNEILAECVRADVRVDFLLLLNPDVVLDPTHIEQLCLGLERHPQAAFSGGKLLRPGRKTIDSAGVLMPKTRRPYDRGKGELDRGQFEREQLVFGVSGAAMMIRVGASTDLLVDGQLFDEDFFLYHEETDLAWRAKLLGWNSLYVPTAVGVHRRRWHEKGRFEMPISVRRHSFKNHYLEMIKNERTWDVIRDAPVLVFWELLRFGYALFRDPKMLSAYAMALRLSGKMWSKRRLIRARVKEGAREPISPWREPTLSGS